MDIETSQKWVYLGPALLDHECLFYMFSLQAKVIRDFNSRLIKLDSEKDHMTGLHAFSVAQRYSR